MFEVHYSEVALADLDDIWGYITLELMNPDAAVNTVNGIIDAIDKLSEYHLSIQSHHLLFQQIALRTCDHLFLIRFPIHMREFSVSVIYHYRSLQKSIHRLVFEVVLAF